MDSIQICRFDGGGEMSEELREGLAKAIDDALNRCECCDCSANYEAAADAGIAYIRQHDDWQPIETAPKDGTWIQAWRKHAIHPILVAFDSQYGEFEEGAGVHVYDLRCWKPIGEPPALVTREQPK